MALRLGARAYAVRRVGRCALATRAADDDRRPAVVSRYPGHLPTSPLQKVAAAAASAVLALRDPTRADMVGTLGEVTGARALAAIRDGLRATAGGRRILDERPTVAATGPADAARLRAECAPGTFGRAYGEFMATHGFDADDRSPVALVDDEELAREACVRRARSDAAPHKKNTTGTCSCGTGRATTSGTCSAACRRRSRARSR